MISLKEYLDVDMANTFILTKKELIESGYIIKKDMNNFVFNTDIVNIESLNNLIPKNKKMKFPTLIIDNITYFAGIQIMEVQVGKLNDYTRYGTDGFIKIIKSAIKNEIDDFKYILSIGVFRLAFKYDKDYLNSDVKVLIRGVK